MSRTVGVNEQKDVAAPVVAGMGAERRRGPLVSAFIRAVRSPTGMAGAIILGALCLVALLAPLIAPFDPALQHPGRQLAPPSGDFLLGTDEFGRDLLSRLMYGARVSFSVAFIAVLAGGAVGVVTGLLAGYRGGSVDAVIMRLYDAVMTFPSILVAIAVVSVIGTGSVNVAWALAVSLTPQVARLTRSSTLVERQKEYVLAARASGLRDRRIMGVHILPNTVAPLLVQLSVAFGSAVFSEAGLSFLGLGTQEPDASWGVMLSSSRAHLRTDPLYGVFPGLALMLLISGLNFFTDALRDAFDPRRARLR